MGTSTIFRRHNDMRRSLDKMTKKELKNLDALSPWKDDNNAVGGWSAMMELHNGNMHPLVWWYGDLIHLKDAPRKMTRKYYSRLLGKHMRSSEWTVFKNYMQRELIELDREHKRFLARQRRLKKK